MLKAALTLTSVWVKCSYGFKPLIFPMGRDDDVGWKKHHHISTTVIYNNCYSIHGVILDEFHTVIVHQFHHYVTWTICCFIEGSTTGSSKKDMSSALTLLFHHWQMCIMSCKCFGFIFKKMVGLLICSGLEQGQLVHLVQFIAHLWLDLMATFYLGVHTFSKPCWEKPARSNREMAGKRSNWCGILGGSCGVWIHPWIIIWCCLWCQVFAEQLQLWLQPCDPQAMQL